MKWGYKFWRDEGSGWIERKEDDILWLKCDGKN